MGDTRSLGAGGAKRGGKTSVAQLRAAAEHLLGCAVADLPAALDALRDALAAEKNATVGYTPEPLDFYCEEQWVTDLLFDAEEFKGNIVDPCCGRGMILKAAMERGFDVRGFDIANRRDVLVADFPFEIMGFLDERHPVGECDNIIMNPPYSYQKGIAEVFIRYALTVAKRKVAALLPNKFKSSNGRYDLFKNTCHSRTHWLMSRPSMPPGSLLTTGKIEATGGKVDYAWFIWERGFTGAATDNYLIRPERLSR